MKRDLFSLRGLRIQILLWVILPLILVLIAFSFTGIRTHRESMRTLVAERDLGLARVLAHDVGNLLDRYRIPLAFLARDVASLPAEQARSRLRLLAAELGPDLSLLLVDAEGEIRAVGGPSPPPGTVVKGATSGSSLQVVDMGGRAHLLWRFPLRGGRVLVAWMPLEALEISRALRAGYNSRVGHVFVLTGEGTLLAVHGRPAPPAVSPSLLQTVVASEEGVVFLPSSEGEQVVAHARVPGTDWYVVVQEPWAALTAPLLHLDRVMPFILLSATVVSLLTLFFGLRYLVAPLRRLRERAERIGRGDFQAASAPVGGLKEIEELREALDHMARQVAAYQTSLQVYLKLLTRAQEEERARLARELHDGTVQSLIALAQRLQMVQRELGRDPEQAARRLSALRKMVNEAIEDVRRFTRALRPLYLEELGLIPALEMLARESQAHFRVEGRPVRLPKEVELAFFRIAQEALSNVQRHAQAQHVALRLIFEEDRVRLIVQDDGRGFQPPEDPGLLVQEGHLGLMNMQERAQIVGGRLTIRSRPGQGTRVEVVIPVPRQTA